MHFSVAVMLSDMEIYLGSTPMKFKRSWTFNDLCQTSLDCYMSTLAKYFSSVQLSQFQLNVQSPGKRGKKVYLFGAGHMTQMASMPI